MPYPTDFGWLWSDKVHRWKELTRSVRLHIPSCDLLKLLCSDGRGGIVVPSNAVRRSRGWARKRGSNQKALRNAYPSMLLPSWMITRCVIEILLAPWLIHTHVRVADRYEVIQMRKIGMGFFSDVYLGHWRKLTVVVKVLAHSVSREVFVHHVEQWNALNHPNILPLYGASSAAGEKPWFLMGKFCSGNNLAASLKRARVVGAMVVGDKVTVRVDLLRFMHEIAKGMAYLHGCGVLHGDLRVRRFYIYTTFGAGG